MDAYPVGSIYMNVNATNPADILGGGTWARIAQGRTLIGEGTSDMIFSGGSTGGESTHKLTTSEMPSHNHDVHAFVSRTNAGVGSGVQLLERGGRYSDSDGSWEDHYGTTAGCKNTGGGSSHNNLPPYLVVYIWQRTA